jgi:hypothetical protein
MTKVLNTKGTDYAHRNGQTVTIVRTISEPDATHDAEVLPMHVVRFPDGATAEVWPDELTDEA